MCDETYDSYGERNLKFKLYDSLEDRNQAFGYDYIHQGALQDAYNNNYFVNTRTKNAVGDISKAPKDYYWDLRVAESSGKTIIGFDDQIRPNLYNDNISVNTPSLETPNLYRSWEPFTTSPMVPFTGIYTTFIPHEPVEVAPNNDERIWTADLNARMMERRLATSGKEDPYRNHNRRQAHLNLISTNVRSDGDAYTKKISSPEATFGAQLERNGGVPPATTSF